MRPLENQMGTCAKCRKFCRVVARYVPLSGWVPLCYQGAKACAPRFDRAIVWRHALGLDGTPFDLNASINAQSWRDASPPRVPPHLPLKVRRALRAWRLVFEKRDALWLMLGKGRAVTMPESAAVRALMEMHEQREKQIIAVLERRMGAASWSPLLEAMDELVRSREGKSPGWGEMIRRSAHAAEYA